MTLSRLTHPSAPRSHRLDASAVRATRAAAVIGTVLALAACASTPPPKEQMAVAEAAVVNATNAGALQWAPAEMRSAQDKLVRAQAAMAAKDHAQALVLANEVRADAQLASTAARAAKAQRAADEVQEANRVLREEMSRKESSAAVPAPLVRP